MAEETATHKHTHKEKRRQYTFNKLKGFGQEIIEDIEKNKVPTLRIPSRGTGNIVYDEDKRYYILGDRFGKRSLGNVKQIRKLGQMVYVANFCKDLVLRDKTATIREMYYISEGWGIEFNTQQESNIVGEDLEVALGATREDLGLMPEEDGASVYGDITLLDGEFEINASRAGKSGYTISPTIDQVELLGCGADFVLAVETMGMFHRLVQENAHKRFNCLIVGLKGQAARATRRFIKRVNEELGLPVYICNDGDPWGFHIAQVIISGSAKLAHVNHDLATPDAKFLGVTASDIIEYDLPTDPLKDIDVLRLKELSKDPRYQNEFWQTEIKKMLKIGKKAEQQSFSKYGLEYVVDTYFPEKLSQFGELN
ncbi:DNA topoisomerase IV subunit A [Methanobrevibacter olleyae]|uniref:Type 2 DNA topoisomerase 6 subunit A n=1 Tax=Methanobrevibacter olleyae TaxID=294671 RepID=A0A126R0H3_METOL|nr:DNA topoisomerase IV subunit A [Methanobrevibacter olleyae]AMK15873.1 DNA topoisomerase VI subunit A [Methanobrevibacter olleyae]SFL21123.1 DNA topoisomerase-6 subunit A [Methanobrevibacter olleyae]